MLPLWEVGKSSLQPLSQSLYLLLRERGSKLSVLDSVKLCDFLQEVALSGQGLT